ncbi:hypothetical protein [Pararhizobium qamdonense]|uniref:hypothetical protein n=1 Tax=Pararhizobium qamdonense TaxID=3031126 RepID=UPI0023E23A50|nr:hypothetical protein [Pararhizobium qamdonense]
MKNVIAFLLALRALIGKEESVDSIMKPITKIANKLERHEARQKETVKAKREAAEQAVKDADAAAVAASQAAAKRDKMLAAFA